MQALLKHRMTFVAVALALTLLWYASGPGEPFKVHRPRRAAGPVGNARTVVVPN